MSKKKAEEYDSENEEGIERGVIEEIGYIDARVVKSILNLIKEGDERITPEKEVVILIGDTGSGKSTLVNYLGGAELFAVEQDDELIIDVKRPLTPELIIGHGKISQTTVPNKWINESNGIVYWDCPGFGDTKGVVQDIVNAFYIKTLFERSEKIKVLAVELDSALRGRAKSFTNLVCNLANLFNDVHDFQEGLCLVVTKAKARATTDSIQKLIKGTLEGQRAGLNEKQTAIFEFLLKDAAKDRIVLFKEPQEVGAIPVKSREDILSMLEKITPVIKSGVNIVVSDKSKLYVSAISDEINENISNSIGIVFNNIENVSKKQLAEKDFAGIGGLLRNIYDLSNFLLSSSKYDLGQLQNAFDFMPLYYHDKHDEIKKLISSIKHNLANLIFFKQVTPEYCKELSMTSIKDSFELAANRILSNIIGESKKIIAEVTDQFTDSISKYARNEELLKFKECKVFLDKVIDKLLSSQNLEEVFRIMQVEVIQRFNISANLGNATPYTKILRILIDNRILELPDSKLSGEVEDIIKYFKESFNAAYHTITDIYSNRLLVLKDSIYNDISKSFKTFCSDVVKIYNSYGKDQLKQAKELNNELQRLKVQDVQNIMSLVKNMKAMPKYIPESDLSAIRLIEGKLQQLKDLREAGINIEEPNIHEYSKEFLILVHDIYVGYQNLSTRCFQTFSQEINANIEVFTLKAKEFYTQLGENRQQKAILCKLFEENAKFSQLESNNLLECVKNIQSSLLSNDMWEVG